MPKLGVQARAWEDLDVFDREFVACCPKLHRTTVETFGQARPLKLRVGMLFAEVGCGGRRDCGDLCDWWWSCVRGCTDRDRDCGVADVEDTGCERACAVNEGAVAELAGRADTLFSNDATALIHQVSRGLPLAVNTVAPKPSSPPATNKAVVDE